MKCPKCQFPNLKGSTFCSACGTKLDSVEATPGDKVSIPANSEITINVVEKKSPKKVGCFGLILILLFVSVVFSAISGNSKNEASSTPSPTETTGSYCAILMKSLNEAVEYMGNAGSKYTVGDVAAVLDKRGSALATGFDVEMAGSVERLEAIQEAGNQLLQIRVNLIDGGDITPAANAFKNAYDYIAASCQ